MKHHAEVNLYAVGIVTIMLRFINDSDTGNKINL